MQNPLADRIRPQNLNEVVGQSHLIGEGKVLRKIIENKTIPNMIFYGPSGTGKTTIANIIAKATNKKLYKLNATNASVSDIKAIISDLDTLFTQNGVLLYLDEIQNFNKKQQQSLLEFIENGKITLIASTTENPYFYIYNAILSRCSIFEFKEIETDEIIKAIERAIKIIKHDYEKEIIFTNEAIEHIANASGGDARKAINTIELVVLSSDILKNNVFIDIENIIEFTSNKAMRYDKMGDSHYDILSAFQKSIRGSDVNASLHYLARLIVAGDLISICRRLLVIASEDVGMAYPMASVIVNSLIDTAQRLGFPEARIPLSQATVLLATSPKSNSAYVAIDKAIYDAQNLNCGEIPTHLKDAHYKGAKNLSRGVNYKYPHDFEKNYVNQQYLPGNIKNKVYYNYGKNKTEQATEKYWSEIKK